MVTTRVDSKIRHVKLKIGKHTAGQFALIQTRFKSLEWILRKGDEFVLEK